MESKSKFSKHLDSLSYLFLAGIGGAFASWPHFHTGHPIWGWLFFGPVSFIVYAFQHGYEFVKETEKKEASVFKRMGLTGIGEDKYKHASCVLVTVIFLLFNIFWRMVF